MATKSKEIPLNFSKSDAPESATGMPSALDRKASKRMLELMCDPPVAIQLWDGEVISTCAFVPSRKELYILKLICTSTKKMGKTR